MKVKDSKLEALFNQKLTSATQAVSTLRSGSAIALGMAVSQPPSLLEALGARAEAGDIDDMKVYYFHAEEFLRKTLLRYSLMGRIVPHSMFLGAPERELIRLGEEDGHRKVVYFVPNTFSQSPRLFEEHIPVDAMLVMVSPMDENGYFTFGTNNDYTSGVARAAGRLIVEVNPNMPRVFGASLLHVSEVDAIVESDRPLPEITPKPASAIDKVISSFIAEMVTDGACLQMGIGALPNAVCSALTSHRNLGIHTELLTPGLVDLVKRGVVDNSRKAINRGKSLSLMEIARSSEMPYPTACRIVQTLLYEGLIEREPGRKRYQPTALVQTLSLGFQGDAHLAKVARPHIVDLTRRLGWPISLTTNVGHSMVIRDSTHALTTLTFSSYHPGFTLPVLECAAGLAYLSHIDDDARENMLNALKLVPRRVNLHMIELFENGALAEGIRRDGYATRGHNRFTRNPGKTSSIALPVFTDNGIAGMLTLAFFSSAMKMGVAIDRFIQPLTETAAAISPDL